ncbi:pentatricopeptide repeat-containing protein At1g06140, mitochondrial [Gastrolobium bilobum]|uniref:pentatricopeptide repeat-containing protein At1g06140, mitochondrial n=1 Tax=Gastrolobium bilobum TaxID=150636 RepID=UPI002AAF8B2E|nr:pentatricopeptide repeat-containing protein At1g06140, mitochondrial [Gastrolobium bilobum]
MRSAPTISSQNPFKTLHALFSYAKSLSLVQQLHAQVIINGLHKEVLYGSNITNAYIQSGSFPLATKSFEQITVKNLRSWNTIISGYSKHRLYGDVLQLFTRLRSEGNAVDSFNLVFAIKASQRLLLLQNGRLLHCLAIKSGLEGDVFIVPALLEIYAELGYLTNAHKLFERYSYRSSVMWGFMIKGYLKFSQESKVFELFLYMTNYFGFRWDAFTVEGLVRACANVLAGREGKASHGVCIKNNLFVNICLLTSVIDMYMKCGFIHYAFRLFEEANDNKDVVLWSAVINGCAKKGRFLEALSVFKRMLENSITPNPVTFAGVILACSGVGSLKQGKSVHGFVIRNRVDLDVVNYTSLVDMYSKCGCVKTAYRIFCMMPAKNVVSWTAMINGCAMNGLYLEALAIFDQMTQNACVMSEKHMPNSVTFISVLSACSHTGMVQEGWRIFNSMKDYAISPTEEHYACMIDVLARAGQFDAALSFLSDMPIKPGPNVWGALLNACRFHKRVELAEEIAKTLLLIEPNDLSLHVLLSNIYDDSRMWEIGESTRMRMAEAGFNKSHGFSSIEVNNKLCVFSSDDTLVFNSPEISHIWNSLYREMRESAFL